MGESSREPGALFKSCSMCTRHCFEHHGNYGQEETKQLVAAPSFATKIEEGHLSGRTFLRVPVLFMEKHNYYVGHKLRLRGPHGFERECVVARHNDGYVLHSGYREFLTHHLIEPGDILTFILIAKQYFLVKMYGNFGEEKGLAGSRSKGSGEKAVDRVPNLGQKSSAPEESGEKAVDRVLKLRQNSSIPEESDEEALDRFHISSRKGKELEGSSGEEPDILDEAFLRVDEANEEALARTQSLREEGEEPETSAATKDQLSGQKRKLPAYLFPGASRRGEDESEREQVITTFIAGANEKQEAAKRQRKAAEEKAASLGAPHQIVFICKSHVSHSITVYLSQLPLPTKPGVVTLIDEAGKNYVALLIRQPDGRARLGRGWNVVVNEHRIAVDDVCLFVSTGKDIITVYIFRLADYYNPPKEEEEQKQDHRDDLQPSALEESISEEIESLGGRLRGAAPSAGIRRPNTGEKPITSHGVRRTRWTQLGLHTTITSVLFARFMLVSYCRARVIPFILQGHV